MMIEINVSDAALRRALEHLQRSLGSTAPLMAAIASALESQTQQAFVDEQQFGGDAWKGLKGSTTAQRMQGRRGKDPEPPSWPGKILNRSGGRGLLGSVFSDSTNSTATVGAGSGKSAAYALIHQFGGPAGRGKRVTIAARPYLPIQGRGSNASLTAKSSETILQLVTDMVNGSLN